MAWATYSTLSLHVHCIFLAPQPFIAAKTAATTTKKSQTYEILMHCLFYATTSKMFEHYVDFVHGTNGTLQKDETYIWNQEKCLYIKVIFIPNHSSKNTK